MTFKARLLNKATALQVYILNFSTNATIYSIPGFETSQYLLIYTM